jgi:hypothetical protein
MPPAGITSLRHFNGGAPTPLELQTMAKSVGKSKPTSKATSSVKPAPTKATKGRSSVNKTGVQTQARVKKTQIAESGKTSRIKGYVSTEVRKSQAKRDQKDETSRRQEASKTPSPPSAQSADSMNIEIRTKGGCSAEFVADMTAAISRGLSRYASRITRIEAHFEDLNGPKGGADHRCGMEARLAARKPVKVSHVAAKSDVALKGAITKLDRLLKSSLGKLKGVKGSISASGMPT